MLVVPLFLPSAWTTFQRNKLNTNILPLFTERACRLSCAVSTATKKQDMLLWNKISTLPLSLLPNVLKAIALWAQHHRKGNLEAGNAASASILKLVDIQYPGLWKQLNTIYWWQQGRMVVDGKNDVHAYPASSPYRLGLQLWYQHLAVLRWNSRNDVNQTWLCWKPILCRRFGFQPESRNSSN